MREFPYVVYEALRKETHIGSILDRRREHVTEKHAENFSHLGSSSTVRIDDY